MPSRITTALTRPVLAGVTLVLALAMATASAAGPASAAGVPGNADFLGAADSFAVLAGTTVTNTGPSIATGDLGVSPGSAVTGFPPGTVLGGIHTADSTASLAQDALGTAYDAAASAPPTANIAGDVGGLTLTAGVYNASSSIGITGTPSTARPTMCSSSRSLQFS